jgi:hypothetical protein
MITQLKDSVALAMVVLGTSVKLGPKKPKAQLMPEFSILDWPVVRKVSLGLEVPFAKE